MDIENQINSIGPIRGSIPILILKLVLALTLFDVFYNSSFYFLNIQFAIPYEFHHHLSLGFFALHIVTIFLQLYFIVYLILQWVNNAYYLYPKQLVRIKGVLNIRRDISNFESILSVSLNQSTMGRLFNYGDILLKVYAFGKQEDIILTGISTPEEYKNALEKYIQKEEVV